MNISKEDFVSAMEEIKSAEDYQEGLNDYLSKHGADGYIYQPDCSITALKLLHCILGERDEDNILDYYCFVLDFGKDWYPSCIEDADGNDIKLQTFEDLYDYFYPEDDLA